MARALSQDLRDRVIDATLAGMSARGAAARFGVGVSTAVAWAGRARQGDRHPQGQKRSSKLDAHRTFLLGLMAEKDDITLAQMHGLPLSWALAIFGSSVDPECRLGGDVIQGFIERHGHSAEGA
jgi:transposase